MREFLFRCGFETPQMAVANQQHGWDDELSLAFFVRSETQLDALSWGCEVVNAFAGRLHAEAGVADYPSWKESQFAYWIEDDPSATYSPSELEKLPRILHMVMPDVSTW